MFIVTYEKGGIILFLYTVIEAVIAVITGIFIAVCTKRSDGVTYGKLDKIAFRKRGKSKLSFAVQFAGVGGIALTFGLFFLFYGNLLRPIN